MRSFTSPLIALAAAAALTLTACGGGGVNREQLTDELVSELEASGDYTNEQITCIADGLGSFSDAELEDIDSGEPSEAVSEKLIDMLSDCLLAE